MPELRAGRPWRICLRLLLLAVALRVLTALLALLANTVFPLEQREQFTVFERTHVFWDTFARYDSGWYLGIAKDGYRHVEGGRNNLAFFPVYPMAMRYAGQALGGRQHHYYLGGIAVSWFAFVGAMLVLYALARLDLDEDAAQRAVVYAAMFPFAFFFGVVYSESTFLLFLLLSFYGFRTKRWWLAGLAGALAVTTRVNGIMAMPAFAWLAWSQVRADRGSRPGALAALALVLAGFAAWCGYVYALSGSPLEWMYSIHRWGYFPGGAPWTPLAALVTALVERPFSFITTERMAPYDVLNGLTALSFTLTIPFVWVRFGAPYGLFLLANLALPLSSGQFEGLGRYCSVLFPVFLWLATFASPTAQQVILVVSSAFYMLALALFTTIHPLF